MRILLDECLPKRLKIFLIGHECTTAPEAGWAGIKNGKLLQLAEPLFDVFLTVDRNLSFQNPTPRFKIAVVVLKCKSNRLDDLKPLVPELLEKLPMAKRGEVLLFGGGSR